MMLGDTNNIFDVCYVSRLGLKFVEFSMIHRAGLTPVGSSSAIKFSRAQHSEHVRTCSVLLEARKALNARAERSTLATRMNSSFKRFSLSEALPANYPHRLAQIGTRKQRGHPKHLT